MSICSPFFTRKDPRDLRLQAGVITSPRSQSWTVKEQRFKPEPGSLEPHYYLLHMESSLGKSPGTILGQGRKAVWSNIPLWLQGPLEATCAISLPPESMSLSWSTKMLLLLFVNSWELSHSTAKSDKPVGGFMTFVPEVLAWDFYLCLKKI